MGFDGSYSMVSSNMAGWKTPELNGGFYIARKITTINGPFSSTPCLITGGYHHWGQHVVS